MKQKLRDATTRYMMRFAEWFASVHGTIQTTIIILAWVIIEQIFPNLDPNGFILLYILTVWSGITQNLLAYVGNISAQKSEESQKMIEKLLVNSLHMMKAMLDLMKAVQNTLDNIRELMTEVKKISTSDAKQIDDMDAKLNKMSDEIVDRVVGKLKDHLEHK